MKHILKISITLLICFGIVLSVSGCQEEEVYISKRIEPKSQEQSVPTEQTAPISEKAASDTEPLSTKDVEEKPIIPSEETPIVKYINVQSANIRSEALETSTILGSVPLNTEVTVVDEVTAADGTTWYQIITTLSNTGYGYILNELASDTIQ